MGFRFEEKIYLEMEVMRKHFRPNFTDDTIFFFDTIDGEKNNANDLIQLGASPLFPANVQSTFLPWSRGLSLSQCLHTQGIEGGGVMDNIHWI